LGFPIVRMICTRCNRTEPGAIHSQPRSYQVDSETRLPVHYQSGWCFDCDGVRNIEDVSPGGAIATIRRAAATLSSATPRRRWLRTGWDCQSYHWLDEGSQFKREFGTRDWHKMGSTLDELANRLAFLSQRSVPARCLHCFGHNTAELERCADGETNGVIHPGCGGRFVVEIKGNFRLAPPTTMLIHHPDGSLSHEEPYAAPSLHSAKRARQS